jgi:hypothetical protein
VLLEVTRSSTHIPRAGKLSAPLYEACNDKLLRDSNNSLTEKIIRKDVAIGFKAAGTR